MLISVAQADHETKIGEQVGDAESKNKAGAKQYDHHHGTELGVWMSGAFADINPGQLVLAGLSLFAYLASRGKSAIARLLQAYSEAPLISWTSLGGKHAPSRAVHEIRGASLLGGLDEAGVHRFAGRLFDVGGDVIEDPVFTQELLRLGPRALAVL